MHELCSNTAVLVAWNYNLEQQNFVLNRFRSLSGWGRRLQKTIISAPALSLVWMGDSAAQQQPQRQRQQLQYQQQHSGQGNSVARRRSRQQEEETPFLLPMLFALQSDDLRLLPLAATLARASRGHWNEECNVFHVASTPA
jgi:hypothetical protein